MRRGSAEDMTKRTDLLECCETFIVPEQLCNGSRILGACVADANAVNRTNAQI